MSLLSRLFRLLSLPDSKLIRLVLFGYIAMKMIAFVFLMLKLVISIFRFESSEYAKKNNKIFDMKTT